MTKLQNECLLRVIRASSSGEWYRAGGHGERVTLASLYHAGVLERRPRRGKDGDADAAYEYTVAKFGLAR